MPEKYWRKLLVKYLLEREMTVEEFEELYDWQKYLINELKKAFKRIDKLLSTGQDLEDDVDYE